MSARRLDDEGRRFARGALWAVGPALVLWALAILLVVWACTRPGG